MTNDYIESVWWSLRQAWDRDRLYQGHKVVPYCSRCGTALSSHEVAQGYKDVEDPSVYVRMPVVDPSAPLEAGDSLLIWTTTPWTLITNAAVAAGPEIEYVRARLGEEVLVLAGALVERVLGDEAEVLDRFPGSALAGTRYEPPFALHHRLRPARAHRAGRGIRLDGGRHRAGAHGDRLRRGRLPPR